MQKRRKSQGLELVSSRFRTSRLALWATGRGPRPSFMHCHGVLALRDGPWTPTGTEAVQNESRLQEDTSRVAVGSAETQEKSRFGASF